MGHRVILSEDAGPTCGLSLKRKAAALIGGHRSPVSPVSPSCVMGQGIGDATRSTMITIAISEPTTPKRLKKKTKSGHPNGAAGTSPRAESERNSKNNLSIGFILGDNRNSDDELDEEVDADEDADLQKTLKMKSRTTTRYSPQSYCHSTCSSPNQQRHEAAISGSHCSSINESCITTTTTNSPQKLTPSLTRRGLSFKTGCTVGRTLGPGLTSSGAELSSGSDSNFGPLSTSKS